MDEALLATEDGPGLLLDEGTDLYVVVDLDLLGALEEGGSHAIKQSGLVLGLVLLRPVHLNFINFPGQHPRLYHTSQPSSEGRSRSNLPVCLLAQIYPG